jgi:hypothetical protein
MFDCCFDFICALNLLYWRAGFFIELLQSVELFFPLSVIRLIGDIDIKYK